MSSALIIGAMHVPGVLDDVTADGILSGKNPRYTLISFVHAPKSHGRFGFGGNGRALCTSVCLELVRNAVAPSTERAYQEFFGSWVEFRLNVVCVPVLLNLTGSWWPM